MCIETHSAVLTNEKFPKKVTQAYVGLLIATAGRAVQFVEIPSWQSMTMDFFTCVPGWSINDVAPQEMFPLKKYMLLGGYPHLWNLRSRDDEWGLGTDITQQSTMIS